MPFRSGPSCIVWPIIAVLSVWSAGPSVVWAIDLTPAQIENRRCFNCHGQSHIADLMPDERLSMVAPPKEGEEPPPESPEPAGPQPELYVDAEILRGTMHADVSCVACHADAQTLPHAAKLAAASCSDSCHADANAAFRRGVHAEALARGDPEAPTCASCHGGHNILPRTDRQSRTYPLNVIRVCADCHQRHVSGATSNGRNQREYVQSYLDSVHGKAVTEAGLIVAATCVDCHGGHEVLPGSNPQSSVNRRQIPQTCGKCHIGVAETYAKSIHGRKLGEGNEQAPVCSDCHTAHAITRAGTPDFMLDIVNECGSCHNKTDIAGGRPMYDTYRRSYHGQVNALGSTRAARCSDCHGAHDILPVDDPASRMHVDNRSQTCATSTCHPGTNGKFAQFQPHADYRDGRNYPLLHGVWLYFVILMSVTFSFYGIHTLLWFVRGGIERFRRGPTPRHKANPHGIKRFNKVDRINHALVILTFFGLTLTGMPLFFSDQGWARVMTTMFGGPAGAGFLHRVFALMLIGNFIVHIVEVVRRAKEHSVRSLFMGPNTMVPRWKDVIDFGGMVRWFFGTGRKPPFDHFTYWEKFDYWAEIFGTCVIGGSGLMLWFPGLVAKLLPGWVFNIAMIVHGYEALLAVGFIFTIHFFNAHLRVEKFPVDDVMFTGQLSEAEFAHERGTEYARLKKEGTLNTLYVPPAPPWQRKVAVIVGLVAMAIGTIIVALIVLAGLEAI